MSASSGARGDAALAGGCITVVVGQGVLVLTNHTNPRNPHHGDDGLVRLPVAGRSGPRVGWGGDPIGRAADSIVGTDLAIVVTPQRQHRDVISWWVIPDELAHDSC